MSLKWSRQGYGTYSYDDSEWVFNPLLEVTQYQAFKVLFVLLTMLDPEAYINTRFSVHRALIVQPCTIIFDLLQVEAKFALAMISTTLLGKLVDENTKP